MGGERRSGWGRVDGGEKKRDRKKNKNNNNDNK